MQSPINILVTGDWVADWNLARGELLPAGDFDGTGCGRQVTESKPIAFEANQIAPDNPAQADSVWWKHERTEGDKKSGKVGRIARFAGCTKAKKPWLPPLLPG